MKHLVFWLLTYLIAWSCGVAGLTFTNSFEGWTGNRTYRISWEESDSDPSYYDLELVRPHGIHSVGVPSNASWLEEWSFKYAIQIPRNGARFIQVPLGPEVWPGVYFWRIRANSITPVGNTFLIASSKGATNPTTITSFVPVTATANFVETTDGHVVTHTASEVYSSAIVYTTIIIIESKGFPRNKIPLVIGLALGLTFLITLPIVLWLILRYRRRPAQSANKIRPLYTGPEGDRRSSVLDLVPLNDPVAGPHMAPASPMSANSRRTWIVADGEKRLVITQDSPQSTIPGTHPDPFADPFAPDSPRYIRQHSIIVDRHSPNASSHNISHINLLSASPSTSAISLGGSLSRGISDMDMPMSPAPARERFGGKQQGRRSNYSEHPENVGEDIALRMIVPGRAVDIGSLGRGHVPDVDENGLLPPDYLQATQSILPQQLSQAGSSPRR